MQELFELGIIKLATDAESIEEFSENRLREYKATDGEYKIYNDLLRKTPNINHLAIHPTQENTTIAIQNSWLDWSTNYDISDFFSNKLIKTDIPSNLNKKASEILNHIKQKAFIARNIYPILFKGSFNKPANVLLEKQICEFFFNTLANEIDSCAIISKMIYLPNLSIKPIVCEIFYKEFLSDLKTKNTNLLSKIINSSPNNLLLLKSDQKIINWIEQFKSYNQNKLL